MSVREAFEIFCPNNHDQTVKFTHEEFERLLKTDTLVFHCNTCDTNWSPTHQEMVMFRKRFAKEKGTVS
jgi:hypothetical protein